jgi:hypothetical protein
MSFMVSSHTDKPRSAVVRDRVETLSAERPNSSARDTRRGRNISSVASTSLGIQSPTLLHAFIAFGLVASRRVHRISATEKPGETRKTAEHDEVSDLPFSSDLPQPSWFLMHPPRLLPVMQTPCVNHVSRPSTQRPPLLHPHAASTGPDLSPDYAAETLPAHINPAVERTSTHHDHAALLPARARRRRGLRVRAPGRARPRAEPAPRARVGRAADECAPCGCAARERRLTRGGR